MRHTLRQMVDGDLAGVCAAASPAAQHVAKHVQDPVGSTKEGFEDLQQKQLDYELAKQNMKRTLMPVKSIIDHVEQTHGIGDDEEMGYQDPNYMDPNMPQNMQPAPGRMQQNFPAANKNVPGTGPGLAQPSGPMVGKPGMPMVKPGMPQQPGMQAPAGQPTGQTNPAAKKPAAGGPSKSAPSKAQGKGRDIKVHVAAGTPVRDARGLRQMESAVAARNMTSCMDGCGETEALVEKKSFKKATVSAGGPGSGCSGPNCGRHPDHSKDAGTVATQHHEALTQMGFKKTGEEPLKGSVVYHHPDPEKFKEALAYMRSKGYAREQNENPYKHKTGGHQNLHPGGDYYGKHWVQVGTEKSTAYGPHSRGTTVDFHNSHEIKGAGCHGENCGRYAGGKGTDKTHLPKKATVAKKK